jgi:hypothetical protein
MSEPDQGRKEPGGDSFGILAELRSVLGPLSEVRDQVRHHRRDRGLAAGVRPAQRPLLRHRAGLTQTELVGHQQPGVQERMAARFSDVEQLHSDDIAEAVEYIVTSPRRRAVAEIVIRPTDQV